jgi:MFS family permease
MFAFPPSPRVFSLFGSFLVAASAGVNYAYSSWAPQLQEQLHLSSTQVNIVGVAGNIGVYLSGPLWGRWVDRRGPYRCVWCACCGVAEC